MYDRKKQLKAMGLGQHKVCVEELGKERILRSDLTQKNWRKSLAVDLFQRQVT